MPDILFEARVRAQRYWYRDGLVEIPFGIVQLMLSGSDLINTLGNRTSSWYMPVSLIYTALILTLAVFASRIMGAIRERITYPRSGYVHESGGKRRIVVGMASAAILATVTGVLALRYAGHAGWDPDRWIQWMPAALGLTTSAVSVYVAVRYGLLRFLVLAVLSFILGVAVSIEYPLKLAMAIWLAGNGCAWVCSGGITLWGYVRTTPSSAAET